MTSKQSMVAKDPIALFMPAAGPEERQLRQRLHNARVISSARAMTAVSEHARQLYWVVNEVASIWVFAPASTEELKDIADGLVKLFMTAATFDRIEGERA